MFSKRCKGSKGAKYKAMFAMIKNSQTKEPVAFTKEQNKDDDAQPTCSADLLDASEEHAADPIEYVAVQHLAEKLKLLPKTSLKSLREI